MSRRFTDFFLSLVAPAVFAFGSLLGFRSPELVAELGTGGIDAVTPQASDTLTTSAGTSQKADIGAHVLAPPLTMSDATHIAPVIIELSSVQAAAATVSVEPIGDAAVRDVGDVTAVLLVPSDAKVVIPVVDKSPVGTGELPLDVEQFSVNATPVATSDSFVVAEDGRVAIDVLSNDRDVDGDRLTVTSINGEAIKEGGAVSVGNGSVALADGGLIFTPSADVNGEVMFTYTVSDGKLSTVGSVTGTINAINDAPVAASDSFVVAEDGRVVIDVLGNDYDIDRGQLMVTAVDGQALTDGGPDVSVADGRVGFLQGQLVFTPTADVSGRAAFTYTISDGDLMSTATVEGLINPAPKPVVASVDTVLGATDTSLILTGSAPLKGTGNALDNVITGNDGANVLDGGAGNDTMAGGLGDDTYIVDSRNDIVRELAGQGIDEVRSSLSYTLPSHVEKLTLIGGGDVAAVGNDLANTITGNSGNNVIDAGGGNDTVAAGAGDDVIFGGAGNDTLSGQDGNDTLNGNDGVDLINGGAGSDVMDGGAGNDGLYGGGGDDRINGGTGNDIIFGDGGNDVIRGGPGSDTLSGGQAGSTLSAGQDTFIWLREDIIDADGRSGRTRQDHGLWRRRPPGLQRLVQFATATADRRTGQTRRHHFRNAGVRERGPGWKILGSGRAGECPRTHRCQLFGPSFRDCVMNKPCRSVDRIDDHVFKACHTAIVR